MEMSVGVGVGVGAACRVVCLVAGAMSGTEHRAVIKCTAIISPAP